MCTHLHRQTILFGHFWPDVSPTVLAPHWSKLQMNQSFQSLFLEAVTIPQGITRFANVTSQVGFVDRGQRVATHCQWDQSVGTPQTATNNINVWDYKEESSKSLLIKIKNKNREVCGSKQVKSQLIHKCECVYLTVISSKVESMHTKKTQLPDSG